MIASLGNAFIFIIIGISILDLFLLIYKKMNYSPLAFMNITFSVSLFFLLEYCFLNDIFEIFYVWNYSTVSQPIVYKIVAIWAGEPGSIMTWMVFNSIVVYFFRIKNQDKEDIVFIRSLIISLIVLIVFLIILFIQNPFEVMDPLFPGGVGLSSLLSSVFMIWHPFFTFIAYAIFLVPFSVVIAEIITPKRDLQNNYQKNYNDFALKFGWLVITLSVGLGAYWASIALSWGRYWGWDPVETVSLLPWIFSTSYFHTRSFSKSNKNVVRANIILIFLSVIFSTLITRGGGLNSLHSFTGKSELVFWVLFVGIILIILVAYIINDVLNHLLEDYKKPKLYLEYLSYFFLFLLSFICLLGLYIPPITLYLSNFFPINPIYIGIDFFNFAATIPAIGLAITLLYCALWNDYSIKSISIFLSIGIILAISIGILIHPMLIAVLIFGLSLLAASISLVKHFNLNKGFKHFFRINSKTIIHIGICLIFMGFFSGNNIFTDIFYITGFFILLIGIIPSIITVFIGRAKSKNST
jgi:cytochrome c-type biogenesis protein CcmF